ncbi:MAG TPA: hypothetical protein VFJ67_06600 [Thermodesulfobacteriota bacterium]|nr:hypothetical protein [Thermodesulfobacteriota bacterium]
MMRLINISLCAVVIILFAGAAHAELYGVAHELEMQRAETSTPRINGIGESSLFLIDPDTGAATLIGPTGFYYCAGLDFHPVTNVLYAGCYNNIEGAGTEQVLVTIDPQTGKGTEIGLFNANGILQDFSFSSDGTLYAYFRAKVSNFLATINIHTGAVNEIGPSGLFGEGNGIGFDQFNDLFLTDTAMLPSLYLLNQSNGLATLVTDLTLPPLDEGFTVINSLDLNPGTNVMFGSLDVQAFSYDNYLVTIDTGTGVVTNIGETVEGLEAIAFLSPRVSNIPTMSEYGMAAIGLALLSISIFALYRRKRVAAD